MSYFLIVLLMVLTALLPTDGWSIMVIRNYTPAQHDRFYVGIDKDFTGAGYDFSGVGYSSSGHWATLVTSNSFISAYHYHPGTGEKVTFQASNVRTTGYQYTVTGGTRIGTTDLWVGWFDNSVSVDSSIERYPILMMHTAYDYFGDELYNYGMRDRIGRNILDGLDLLTVGPSTGLVAVYDYDNNDVPSMGGDETYLQPGDSGGPSFSVVASSLALVGTHWAISKQPTVSFDTFIPAYYDEVNLVLAARDQSLMSMSVPEPALFLYLQISLLLLRSLRPRCTL